MPDRYHTAQICINGHIITDSIQVDPIPGQEYCEKCGEQLITTCPNCHSELRGRRLIPDLMSARIVHLHKPPSFCFKCGKPYPWIESKLEAAKELTETLEDISDEEKEILIKSIDEIIVDTPKTEVAAINFKKIVSKVGKPIADSFKNILISTVSETAKKLLWPE